MAERTKGLAIATRIEIKVEGDPCPATRQTKRERWSPKPATLRYREYRDRIALSVRAVLVSNHIKTPLPSPVELSFRFAVKGHPALDLDNLIKAVKDALVKEGVISNDTIRDVPRYREPVEAVMICDSCPKRNPKRGGGLHQDCGAVTRCHRAWTWFAIIVDLPDDEQDRPCGPEGEGQDNSVRPGPEKLTAGDRD